MNFKKLVRLVVILFFVSILSGCLGTMGGALKGLGKDLQSLSSIKQDGEESSLTPGQLAANKASIDAEELKKLNDIFLTPGVEPGVAVANTKQVFKTTGNQLAWQQLVDVYFIGNKDGAIEWLKKVPEPGFALAIMQSFQFAAADQLRAVEKTCNRVLWGEYVKANFPPKRVTKSTVKKCPGLQG